MAAPHSETAPPIWIPGAGSLETMEFVAKRRYAYKGIPYFHIDVFRRNFAFFRECCEKEGYTASPDQMGWLLPIYVSETDEQAWSEFEPHLWYFVDNLVKGLTISPPGYTSVRSALKIKGALGKFIQKCKTRAGIEAGHYALVGSASTVRDKLSEFISELGVGNVLGLFQFGSMPTEMARNNMTRFANEVLPELRRSLGMATTTTEKTKYHDLKVFLMGS